MNIKFCYKDEIHKTFYPPPNFIALLTEIKMSFGDRLPPNFILQYKDKDGDLITMSSDLEYSSMLRFDTPRTKASSFKIYIIPSDKPLVEDKDASFEVVEHSSSSFSEDAMREFSLSPKSERKMSRATSQRNSTPSSKYSQSRPKSLSFSDCGGEGSELMSPELELPPIDINTESLHQLYKTREMIIQECLSSSPSRLSRKGDKSERMRLSCTEDQYVKDSENLEGAIAMKEIDKFMEELEIKKEKAQRMRISEREVQQSRYSEERVLRRIDNIVNSQPTQPILRPYYSDMGVNYQEKPITAKKVEYQMENDENFNPNLIKPVKKTDSALFKPVECERNLDSSISMTSSLEAKYSPSQYMPDQDFIASLQGYGITLTPIQMYSCQAIVGLSSSVLFLSSSDGQGTAYKTVYLKNTGMKPWKKCLVKPAGAMEGKTVEVCNVEVGNIALVTLELMGTFKAGIYQSQWKVVHENEYGVVETMGEPFDVEFVIEEASIMSARREFKSPRYESFSEEKSKTSTEGTFREDSEEEEEQEEESGSEEEENIYGIGMVYSKEYLDYRDQITNKAKEIKKIFPDDTPDEIIRFVMERSELNFEDLLVAYLAMKDGEL